MRVKKFISMSSIRIDFRGPSGILYTCTLEKREDAALMLHEILVDDQYCPEGPYFMACYDIAGVEAVELHTYSLCAIPPHTAAVFRKYNEKNPGQARGVTVKPAG